MVKGTNPLDGVADFLAVAEAASFTLAATRLGRSKAAVSDAIARLERRLGVRLLHRNSRYVRLTEAGLAYRDRLAGLLDTVAEAECAATELQKKPRGTVRVTAPWIFAWQRIAPLLAPFAALYPDLTIDLHATNRVVDLVEEGFDLAIRGSTRHPPNMIVRRLGSHGVLLVATPSYLCAHGTPATPAELERHRCALFNDLPTGRDHVVLHRGEERACVALRGTVASNSVEVLREVVLGGYGFGLMPDFCVDEDVKSGRLRVLLPEWCYLEIVIQAVYPDNRQIAAKVRAFVDFLARRL